MAPSRNALSLLFRKLVAFVASPYRAVSWQVDLPRGTRGTLGAGEDGDVSIHPRER